MSRRRAAEKRQVLPDPIYNSVVLNKFINEVMIGGKKTVAQKIVYGALDIIKTNNQADDPLEYFQKSINNVKPSVEVNPHTLLTESKANPTTKVSVKYILYSPLLVVITLAPLNLLASTAERSSNDLLGSIIKPSSTQPSIPFSERALAIPTPPSPL